MPETLAKSITLAVPDRRSCLLTPSGFTLLFLVGTLAGICGTIAGLGGGFIVIPTLRLFYGVAPATAAGVSLVIVVANAISGSFAYLRQRRADVRAALSIALTAVPSSLLGVYLVRDASSAGFDLLYGGLLFYFFIELVRRVRGDTDRTSQRITGFNRRVLVDAYGQTFCYATDTRLTLLCGVAFGFVSSFFGIGGGIVFVIFFIRIFGMPTHIVSATSTLAMLMVAPVGLAAHVYVHDVDWNLAIPLALGGVAGGQIGPLLARRMSSSRLMAVIAGLLLVAACALLAKHIPSLPARTTTRVPVVDATDVRSYPPCRRHAGSLPPTGCGPGVFQKASNGRRAYSARHRCDRAGENSNRFEIHVADHAGFSTAHARVHHRGIPLHVVSGDHSWLVGRADENIGLASERAQTRGRNVGYRYGSMNGLVG